MPLSHYTHVVLISLDTLRSDALSITPGKTWPQRYGTAQRAAPRTALLDELATKSLFFPNTLSAAPYTSASHASYFTGQWPARHGVYEFFNRALASETLFTWARKQGYRTLFKVDFPIILGRFLGFDRDIDEYIVEDDEAFLDGLDANRPTFSFVHFGGAHLPYGFHNLRYGGDAYVAKVEALEKVVGADLAGRPSDRLVETYRDPRDLDLLLRYKRIVQALYSAGKYTDLMDLYLDGVEHFLATRFDPFLNRLMDKLRGSRALIVLFGDHGEEYDEVSYGHFNTVAHGVLRVPMLLHGEDVPRQMRLDQVRAIDLAPTLVDLLGWPRELKRSMDGESLLELDGPASAPRVSYAQSYVAETDAFIRYQRQLLEGGDPGIGLTHVRFREAVYARGNRLTQQNYAWEPSGFRAVNPIRALTRLAPDGTWQPSKSRDLERELVTMLDRYNATIRPGEAVDAPLSVRQQLVDQGYHV